MNQLSVTSRLFLVMTAINKAQPEFFRDTRSENEVITLKVQTTFDNSLKQLELDMLKGAKGMMWVQFRVKNIETNMCYDSGFTDDINEDMTIRVKDCFKKALTKYIDNF